MNTRKIKSRFRRDHLVKLAKQLLEQDLNLKNEVQKWFVLRPGHSVEEMADSVAFKEVRPYYDKVDDRGRHWHTVYLVFVHKCRNYRGELFDVERKVEFCEEDHWKVEDRGKAAQKGWSIKFTSMSFEEQIDYLIKWELMRHLEHIVKDNSAIPIYI